MFPHYFGTDLSAAFPWMISGFIAGILLAWLWRAIGSGQAAKTAAVQSLLQTQQTQIDERQSAVARLQSDTRHLEAALAEAEQRAAKAPDLARQNALLAQAELKGRNEAVAVQSELRKLRGDVETYTRHAHALEQELRRLIAESAALKAASDTKDSELSQIKDDLFHSALSLQSVPSIKVDLEKSQAELAALRTELESRAQELVASIASYDTLARELHGVRGVAEAHAQEIERLKSSAASAGNERVSAVGGARSRRIFPHSVVRVKGIGPKVASTADGDMPRSGVGLLSGGAARANGKPVRPLWNKSNGSKSVRKFAMGRVWPAGDPLRGVKGRSLLVRNDSTELEALKTQVAALAEEAENYRRLRDAVSAANKIANEET